MRMRASTRSNDTTHVATHDEADRHTDEFGAERGRVMRAPPYAGFAMVGDPAATELGAGHLRSGAMAGWLGQAGRQLAGRARPGE